MGRAPAILQSDFPYNINSRCINKEWFNLPMDQVWEIFSDELYMTCRLYNLRVHSFVLMSNHFHLIASTPDANISQCMHRFMGSTSHRLNELGNRINETYAGRHFKTVLQQPNYFLNAYKYNYRNPVDAGICTRVEDYPFSTLHGLLGKSKLLFPVLEDTTLFEDVTGCLQWLNQAPDEAKREAVRYALKRPYYKPKKEAKTNRLVMGENDLL